MPPDSSEESLPEVAAEAPPEASADAPPAAAADPGEVAARDLGVDPDAETRQADSCRQIRGDGTEEDCNQSAVWPWMIAGGGVLLAGAWSAGGHGGASPASDSHATAAAPVPPPAPAPAPVMGTGTTGALTPPPPPPEAPLPAAPRLSTSSGKDTIAGAGHVEVALATPGASWVYRIDGDNTWHAGQGNSIGAGILNDGVHAVMVAEIDDQGRRGDVATLAVRVHDEALAPPPTPDLTPPEAPLLQTSNGTDLLNAKDFINVSGIEAGASWKFRVNGQGDHGPGDWIEGHDGRIPSTALSDGENRVDVVQVDAAGNVGAVATLAVRQDLDAPDPLRAHVAGGHGDLVPLTGAVAVDNLEAGATWKYRINGESDWHVGTGSQLAANYLVEGRNDVALMQTDSAGHDSGITAITVTRDSLVPDRPDLATSNDLPVINAQGSLLVHRLEDAATWEYRIDGGDWQLGTGDALAAGLLHDGNQTVDVRQSDKAGNVSEVASLAVTVDNVAPEVLRASVRRQGGEAAAEDHLINASGYVSVDNLEAGATWQFKVNGDDHWRQGLGTQLSSRFFDEGANAVEVRQIDAAGNAGAAGAVQLTLDSTPPVIEVIGINAVFASDSRLQLNGQSSVEVKTHGSDTADVRVGGGGYNLGPDGGASWAAEFFAMAQRDAPVQSTLLVTASDKAGNTSSRTVTVVADVIAPVKPDVALKNDTGPDRSDRVTSDATVQVTGLKSGDYVHYSLDNGQHWSDWQSSGDIPGSVFGSDGVKNVQVQVADSFLNVSPTSSLQFTLNSSVI
ncbi:hypothetical protein [Mitsuaria sp. 7]|uniref:hypothetical protein n=1 Tax=Mitsuaria sp. 7 TaxID=1658665 RepID=UPI0012F8D1B8|nr:hypothetical protein [Mitsuaria sp. 7]